MYLRCNKYVQHVSPKRYVVVVILPSLGLFFCFHGELELESGPWSASYVAFVSCFSGHKLSSRRVEGAAADGGGDGAQKQSGSISLDWLLCELSI